MYYAPAGLVIGEEDDGGIYDFRDFPVWSIVHGGIVKEIMAFAAEEVIVTA